MSTKALLYPAFPMVLAVSLVVALAACGESPTPVPPTESGPAEVADSPLGQDPTVAPTEQINPTETPTSAPTVVGEGEFFSEDPSTGIARVTSDVPGSVGSRVPELKGISGWLQTEPFTFESLRGQVVLVDFWTYTCVNCIRTLPYLKQWHDSYADEGLVIVGVHAPEFEFEKKTENVVASMERYELKYPVVQDNDFKTWRSFGNRYWPAKYLIDKDGIIRYRHFGEGAYDETEEKIRELLAEAGASLSDTLPGEPDGVAGLVNSGTGQTRELYAGQDRNSGFGNMYIGNAEYYSAAVGEALTYGDPGDHKNHFLYLSGQWIKERERVVHARGTESLDDYIALWFQGSSVNVVIDFPEGDPFEVVVTLDGAPVPEEVRGEGIRAGDDGTTFVPVNEGRMYNLLQGVEGLGHALKLSSNSDRFGVHAFTFGSYEQGP